MLVTGMSGTGKLTALTELDRRGHCVIDTDDLGWIVETRTASGPEPLWDLDQIKALIDGHSTGWLFIGGCVANQGAAYDRFDAVVLLSAPIEVILGRVANRANPFGSTAGQRTKIVNDLEMFEPRLRAGADREIVTTAPVSEVVSALDRSPPALVIETRFAHVASIAPDSLSAPLRAELGHLDGRPALGSLDRRRDGPFPRDARRREADLRCLLGGQSRRLEDVVSTHFSSSNT